MLKTEINEHLKGKTFPIKKEEEMKEKLVVVTYSIYYPIPKKCKNGLGI